MLDITDGQICFVNELLVILVNNRIPIKFYREVFLE